MFLALVVSALVAKTRAAGGVFVRFLAGSAVVVVPELGAATSCGQRTLATLPNAAFLLLCLFVGATVLVWRGVVLRFWAPGSVPLVVTIVCAFVLSCCCLL